MAQSKRRSIVPGALVVAGLVGLGIAAASHLEMEWGGTLQAGTVVVDADCQVDTDQAIGVAFSSPYFVSTKSIPWTVDDVVFSEIPEACQGADMDYQAAYRTADGDTWNELGEFATVGSNATLSVDLEGADPLEITEFALTIKSADAS